MHLGMHLGMCASVVKGYDVGHLRRAAGTKEVGAVMGGLLDMVACLVESIRASFLAMIAAIADNVDAGFVMLDLALLDSGRCVSRC